MNRTHNTDEEKTNSVNFIVRSDGVKSHGNVSIVLHACVVESVERAAQ